MTSHRVFIALLALVVLATSVTVASATTCTARSRPCQATVTVTEYTGQPTVICLQGVPVVRIEASAQCLSIAGGGGGAAGPVVLIKCGLDDDSFAFTGGGYRHKIGLAKGDWEDVFNGHCQGIVYEASRL